jgi:hypothetical protein
MPAPSLDEGDADAGRRTRHGRWKLLAVLAVCAAPVLASYLTYFVIRPQGRANYSELISPTRELPASLQLTDLQGQPVSPASLRDQWTMVVVADAACNADCESHLLLQRQLRETLGKERDRVDKLWLVTDDAVPRPEVIQAISQGEPTRVLRVAPAALAQWLQPAAGRALSDHIYVVDPMGHWMMRSPVQPDPGRFKRDIERLLRASSFWDKPGH